LITNLVNRRLISLHINVINPNESEPVICSAGAIAVSGRE
jgi:hypothetical protein